MFSNNVYEEFFSVNHELQNLISSIHGLGGLESNKRTRVATAFLAKAAKTHHAIILLCRHGYGEDAEILARSLFDMVVDLLYMMRFKRDTMFDRYELWDYVEREKMLNSHGKTRHMRKLLKERESSPQKGDESYSDIFKQARIARKRFKYGSSSWRPYNLRKMAEKVRHTHTYDTMFKMLSQVAHTAPRIINNYVKIVDGNLIYTSEQSQKNVADALISGFWLTATILKQFTSLTNTVDMAKITELETRNSQNVALMLSPWDESSKSE